MERVTITFNDSEKYDAIIAESKRTGMMECGDLEIITKEGATVGGKSGAMITFTVMYKGKRRRGQAVTTLNNLAGLFAACQGRAEFEHMQKGDTH